MLAFKDCKECVPPKRHVGCHATCPYYIESKKQQAITNKRRSDATSSARNYFDTHDCAFKTPKSKNRNHA